MGFRKVNLMSASDDGVGKNLAQVSVTGFNRGANRCIAPKDSR